MVTAFAIELLIALKEGERPSPGWWAERCRWGARRAGGMPPEVADLARLKPQRVTDPESGQRLARVTVPLPAELAWGRARELAHMLTSALGAEGHTLRAGGARLEEIPGDLPEKPEGELGPLAYSEARVCSRACLACVMSSESRLGCCAEGGAFSLADIGAALLAGDEQLVARVLALPGELDGEKWHPYLSGGRCVFHDRAQGCTLPPARMPLQCRTYLCAPDKLLPAHLLADYPGYVEALEEAEDFIADHMRLGGGVDFTSPLDKLKEAAARAFAAWGAASGEPGSR